MTIPNIITLVRIALSPIFMFCFVQESASFKLAAFFIVILSEFSDFLDGYIARKYNAVSDIGKVLDPLADSISRFSAFLCFLYLGYAKLWMVAIFFYRDSFVSWLRIVAAMKNKVIAARITGKIKAVFQGIATIGIIILATLKAVCKEKLFCLPQSIENLANLHFSTISFWLLTIACIITAYSAIDYFVGNRSIFRQGNPE